jgi:hypothetical protein
MSRTEQGQQYYKSAGVTLHIVRWRETEDGPTTRSEFFNAEEAIACYKEKKEKGYPFVELS